MTKFKNEDPDFKEHTFTDFLKWQISKIKFFKENKSKKMWPKQQIEANASLTPLAKVKQQLHISYVGHVTFLIQVDGINILTDPVWSDRASPFGFIGPARVQKPGIQFDNLPKIDIVLISHNHYDHMDIPTLKKLHIAHKPLMIVPIGNETTIQKAIPDARICTLNWGESYIHKPLNDELQIDKPLNDELQIDKSLDKQNSIIKIYLESAQHWSARGLFDRNRALWGTFIVQTSLGDVCFIGDSGYNQKIFKQIAQKHQNILVSLIPIGAYKPRWFMKGVHMDPAEALQTHIDLKSKYSIASHFNVFPLADDSYDEAAEEFAEKRFASQISETVFILPKVGQSYIF